MGAEREDATWRITMFGGLRASRGAVEIGRFETRKTAALLACLALFRRNPLSRELLVEQLWPEEAPEATRNRLRQALSTIRRLLEPAGTAEVVVGGRNEVGLNPDMVTTDVAEFEAALQ